MSTYAEFRHRRAFNGFAAERTMLLTKLRELEGDQTHFIILTCGWFNDENAKLSPQQQEWKAKRIENAANLKETICKLEKICKPPKPVALSQDFEAARENNTGFDELPTRTQNRLADLERSSREFQELSAAIMGVRKT